MYFWQSYYFVYAISSDSLDYLEYWNLIIFIYFFCIDIHVFNLKIFFNTVIGMPVSLYLCNMYALFRCFEDIIVVYGIYSLLKVLFMFDSEMWTSMSRSSFMPRM